VAYAYESKAAVLVRRTVFGGVSPPSQKGAPEGCVTPPKTISKKFEDLLSA
jgi:hypothetical protein